MTTTLTSTQMGDLERLFSTPVESGGDGNAYTPNTVSYNGTTWKPDGNGGYVSLGDLYGDNQYHFDNYDTSGSNFASGEGQMSSWSPEQMFLASVAGLVGGGLAIGGPGAFGFGGTGVGGAGTGASLGTDGVGASFGIVDNTVGLSPSLGTSAAGTGLKATTGSGLNLASATGAPGISASLGPGLDLAASTGGGLGLDAAVGGSTLLSGANLGTGLANGTGTLLGPTALSGTTTLANGTVLPPVSGGGSIPTPSGTTGLPPVPGGGKSSGSGLTLNDLVGLIGGAWNMHNQQQASGDMLDFLKGRMAINDNMYAPGSPEYNALWDQMSRKDAAAGRNSQYGPRSVDLAARIAGLKMDANTNMTKGIANVYANSLNQGANAPAGLLANLGDSDFLDNISFDDITNWIGDFFD